MRQMWSKCLSLCLVFISQTPSVQETIWNWNLQRCDFHFFYYVFNLMRDYFQRKLRKGDILMGSCSPVKNGMEGIIKWNKKSEQISWRIHTSDVITLIEWYTIPTGSSWPWYSWMFRKNLTHIAVLLLGLPGLS